jgi:5-methylcytosine-specific restriction endonuclease McrA
MRKRPARKKRKKILKTSTKLSILKGKNKRRYTKKYLMMRNEVLLRDRYECQLCKAIGVKLECHHVVRWAKASAVRQNKRNLISLCKTCHNSIRNKEDRYVSIFRAKIAKNTERARKEKLTLEELIARKKQQEQLTGKDISYEYKDPSIVEEKKKVEDYLRVTWRSMKRRITNPKSSRYHRYGGRGITIFPEWLNSFQKFKTYIIENLGDRPDGYSLDRINNDGNYEPGNLRWATAEIQKQNNSQTKLDDVMAEVIFILFHKYKKKQTQIMRAFEMNNPTAVRNIVKGLAWNNITYKYKALVSDKVTLMHMEDWNKKTNGN